MSDASDGRANVLVVDDEPEVADMYAELLKDRYDVEVAYGGEEALEMVDEGVDVVLLDRRMPGLSGDDVLDELREWDLPVRVIMVTAVDPRVDIMEMEFDDYLCKPVAAETLYTAVEQQLRARNYDDRLAEFFEVTAKLGVLEAHHPGAELHNDEEYQALQRRAETLRDDLGDLIDGFDDLAYAFKEIDRG